MSFVISAKEEEFARVKSEQHKRRSTSVEKREQANADDDDDDDDHAERAAYLCEQIEAEHFGRLGDASHLQIGKVDVHRQKELLPDT